IMSTGWKVLVYLAADNNLKEEGVFVLTEIAKGCTPSIDGVEVVAQFDTGNKITVHDFNSRASATGHFNIAGEQYKGDSRQPNSAIIKEFLSENAAEAQVRNLIILSGHGGGAVGDFLPQDTSRRGLNISTLGDVIKSVKRGIDNDNPDKKID